jgi:hypothetical protein
MSTGNGTDTLAVIILSLLAGLGKDVLSGSVWISAVIFM